MARPAPAARETSDDGCAGRRSGATDGPARTSTSRRKSQGSLRLCLRSVSRCPAAPLTRAPLADSPSPGMACRGNRQRGCSNADLEPDGTRRPHRVGGGLLRDLPLPGRSSLCVYIYIYIYVYILYKQYVYRYIFTIIYIYTHAYIHIYTQYIYIYIHLYIYIYIYV